LANGGERRTAMQEMANDDLKRQMGKAARSLDEHGKRLWREHEREVREGGRRAGYVATAIVNLIVLYIMNNLLLWHVPFLTDSFVAPLAIMNISLLATVAANLLFLVFDPEWFRLLVRLGLNLVALAAMYTLYIIFPFDFGVAGWDTIVRITLVLGMVGVSIGTIVDFIRLVFGLHGR
jgi:hypothetical protein